MTARSVVENFLVPYQAAFATLDPTKISAFYAAPFFGINRQITRAFASRDDVLANFVQVTNDFRALGVAALSYEIGECVELSSTIVHGTVRWRIAKQSGELIKNLQVVYVLWQSPEGWRIASVYTID